MTTTQPDSAPQTPAGLGRYAETFSPVTVTEATGATFLGIIALILLVALLRALARNRQLEGQLARGEGMGS